MKKQFLQSLTSLSILTLLLFYVSACSSTEDNIEPSKISPDAETISDYISNMNYNPDELFEVRPISGAVSRKPVGSPSRDYKAEFGGFTDCVTQRMNLETNYDEIPILRRTEGVIYPGALVIADRATVKEGIPTAVSIGRAPVSLRLDLPGIGERGNIVVDDVTNTGVNSKIDEALEWWNANARPEGYTIASNSSYSAASSYSSDQLSVDVGLSAKWARGDAQAQFNYTTSREKKVAMMVFKQRFYTVTMNTPRSPGSIFGADTEIGEVESKFGTDGPPAYVHSVSYGRIIMFRMESEFEAKDGELTAALNYAAGKTGASGELEVRYQSILSQSTITVVTMGGNAEAASKAVSAKNFGDLNEILEGENAVYSRNNPGVPIAYSIKYLKDNRLAKVGFTTEYGVETCTSDKFPSKDVNLNNKNGFLGVTMRFRVDYKTKDGGNVYKGTVYSGDIKTNKKVKKEIPEGAYDITITIEFKDGFKWKFLYDADFDKPTERCYESTQSFSKVTVKKVSC